MTITVPPRPFDHFSAIPVEKSIARAPVLNTSLPPEKSFGVANSAFILGEDAQVKALTDRGTAIPLFHYQALITPTPDGNRAFQPERDLAGYLAMLEEQFLERTKKPQARLQRVRELNPRCNCHGWTFASGQYGVHEETVPLILREHGYQEVQTPRHGDVAVYRAHGVAVHSGFVRVTVAGHETLVESKWGPFGVFLHTADAHPGVCTFYRTSRFGDALKIVRIAQDKTRG